MKQRILYFVAGAVVGAGSVYIGLNAKYKLKEKKLLEQVTDWLNEKEPIDENPEESKDEEKKEEKAEQVDVFEYVRELGYTDYTSFIKGDKKEPAVEKEPEQIKPKEGNVVIIKPEDFTEEDGCEDYDCITLYYYSDGVLAEGSTPINDVKELVGDAIDHIGSWEVGCIHCRNNKLKTYFEIIERPQTFKEYIASNPY